MRQNLFILILILIALTTSCKVFPPLHDGYTSTDSNPTDQSGNTSGGSSYTTNNKAKSSTRRNYTFNSPNKKDSQNEPQVEEEKEIDTTVDPKAITNIPIIESESTANAEIIAFAKKYVGKVKYKYGGTSPDTGFDCSGFVQYVYKHFGTDLPRTSASMSTAFPSIDISDVEPGDLLFFSTSANSRKVGHVAIAYQKSGDNISMIHATRDGGISIENFSTSYWWKQQFIKASKVVKQSQK